MLFSNDTGILGKRNSEFSQQESNLRVVGGRASELGNRKVVGSTPVGRTRNFFFRVCLCPE